MKTGRKASASAGLEIPRRRSSLTSRSCSVLLARSTRPFAWGLYGAETVDVEVPQRAPELRAPGAALGAVAGLHVKDTVPIAVERHRLAVALEVAPGGVEIVEGGLDVGESRAQAGWGRRREISLNGITLPGEEGFTNAQPQTRRNRAELRARGAIGATVLATRARPGVLATSCTAKHARFSHQQPRA